MTLLPEIKPADPPVNRGRGRPNELKAIAAQMRANPGQWFIYAEAKTVNSGATFAYRLRRHLPDAETTCVMTDGVGQCYGRAPEVAS